ncbi:MAG: hypothetical protein ABGX41_10010, partial [Pseudohongiella sp.]
MLIDIPFVLLNTRKFTQNASRCSMSFRNQIVSVAALLALASLFVPQQSVAQNSTNPYAIVEGWAKLPGGRVMGAVGKAKVDPDGRH